jgi:predicted transposase YbfD/YdcC
MADFRRFSLDEVVRHFAELEDPRSTVNLRHPLVSVVVIALMAVLAGASGPTAIADWATLKQEFLLSVLNLPNGIPRKDVFRRVLMALKPGTFQACFANWLQSLRLTAAAATGVERPVLAVDGKTVRRSHDRTNGLGALHSVSVWASDFGLSLGQVACAEKSNEITAIPELLRLVDIKGAIITIDAMGTQKAIADQIIESEADYVLALKGNQGTLHQAVIGYIDEQSENNFANVNARRHQTQETGHGREETRSYIQMPVPQSLPGLDRWKGLKSIGMVVSECVRDEKETVEIRYFISSLGVGVKRFAHAVRSHWGIENSCHWCLDVTYREDESRIRDKNMRENFAWLNRLTLSLLKQHAGRQSVARKRRSCGWSEGFLLEILTGATL